MSNLTIDDFQSVSDRIPYLADLKPSGKFVQEDLHSVGGTPAVMKYLLEEGLMDGSCLTVTGKTLAENLESLPGLEGRPDDRPHRSTIRSKRADTFGSCEARWLPKVRSPRSPAKKGLQFTGPARCLRQRRRDAGTRWKKRRSKRATSSSFATKVPKVDPGMPEMLTPTSAIMGAGLGARCRHDDRRSIQRRQSRFHRRTHHARSTRRRPDWLCCKTATS